MWWQAPLHPQSALWWTSAEPATVHEPCEIHWDSLWPAVRRPHKSGKKKLQVQTHTHLGVFSRVQYTQPHLFRRVHHPLNEVCHPISTLYTGRDVIFVTPANTQHKIKKKMFQVSSYIFSWWKKLKQMVFVTNSSCGEKLFSTLSKLM